MEAQRLEVLERQLKRLERRMRGMVLSWVVGAIGVLLFGLVTHAASSGPASPDMLVVRGIKVVDEQGRIRASIDAHGNIKGSGITGDDLSIGISSAGFPLFTTRVLAVPRDPAITIMELRSPGAGSSVFSAWVSDSAANTHIGLQQNAPSKYVQLTLAGLEGGRGGRPAWHLP